MEMIPGGGETVQLKPQLVKDDQGRLCMRVELGQYSATLPLPDHIVNANEERQQQFFDALVPQITEDLRAMAAKDRRKNRKKAMK